PTVLDIGANVGMYALWAARRYQPERLYCYEASPRTFGYLEDNLARLVDRELTSAKAFHRAITGSSAESLVLHQHKHASASSTLLAGDRVSWIQSASDAGELETHRVTTSTVSRELEIHQLAVVDILKIDVEGYYIQVL